MAEHSNGVGDRDPVRVTERRGGDAIPLSRGDRGCRPAAGDRGNRRGAFGTLLASLALHNVPVRSQRFNHQKMSSAKRTVMSINNRRNSIRTSLEEPRRIPVRGQPQGLAADFAYTEACSRPAAPKRTLPSMAGDGAVSVCFIFGRSRSGLEPPVRTGQSTFTTKSVASSAWLSSTGASICSRTRPSRSAAER